MEDISSTKSNFYKTENSVPDAATKYGVSLGTAPYIGTPAAVTNNDTAADIPAVVVPVYKSPKMNTVISATPIVLKANWAECTSGTECLGEYCGG